MRYLEQCIADLKNVHHSRRDTPSSAVSETAPPPFRQMCDEGEDEEDDEDEDEEMEDTTSPIYADNAITKSVYQFANTSPAIYPSDRSVHSHSTTTSPAILPRDRGNFSANPSPALQPSDPHRYSLTSSTIRSTINSPSIQASPAFRSSHSAAPFLLTSPALKPQADREDHEATEALLMLNTDRRSWSGARGMSVKDILSG
jgi:uncharacterized membrane protein